MNLSGEKQPWAEPRDKVRVVDKNNPLERKPYGTFSPQMDPDGHMPSDVLPKTLDDDQSTVASSDSAQQLVKPSRVQLEQEPNLQPPQEVGEEDYDDFDDDTFDSDPADMTR